MTEDYINKTRIATDFLCEVYNDDIPVVAEIRTAQAEGDTQFLINELCAVRDFAQGLINDLKKYCEKRRNKI